MAKLQITTLWNVNVILNGVNTVGRLAEFELPQPKRKMVDYKSLGLAAGLDIPVGWDKMESTLKWESYDPNVLTQLMSQSAPAQLTINADAQLISATGAIQDIPVTGHIVGPVVDPGPIMFKAQENAQQTTKLAVWHVDLAFNGQQIYLLDVLSNQFFVNGVDQLANFRANLGA